MPASRHGEHGGGTENAIPQFAGGTLDSKLVRPEISSAIIASASAVHRAQLLTYLRLSRLRLGLLINFNVSRLRDGIARVVL